MGAILVAITNGIHPYHDHTMGWASPQAYGLLAGGVVLLAAFAVEHELQPALGDAGHLAESGGCGCGTPPGIGAGDIRARSW